jgi:hypothetical protein
MFFYNRTGYTKTIRCMTRASSYSSSGAERRSHRGIRDENQTASQRPLDAYTFSFNYEDYPNLAKLDLRGSDAGTRRETDPSISFAPRSDAGPLPVTHE